jgi:uncharacterized protein (DUF2252 family)
VCIGHCEAKRHKPWFDEECSKLVDRGKQAKLEWLQYQSVVNEDNLSNVRREASRHFRNKKRVYLKGKIKSLNNTVRIRTSRDLHRGMYEFKRVMNLELSK